MSRWRAIISLLRGIVRPDPYWHVLVEHGGKRFLTEIKAPTADDARRLIEANWATFRGPVARLPDVDVDVEPS